MGILVLIHMEKVVDHNLVDTSLVAVVVDKVMVVLITKEDLVVLVAVVVAVVVITILGVQQHHLDKYTRVVVAVDQEEYTP